MAFRYLVGGADMPQLTANKAAMYANDIAEALWSDAKAAEVFRQAVEIIDKVLGEQKLTRDLVKTQGFTDAVKAAIREHLGDSGGSQ